MLKNKNRKLARESDQTRKEPVLSAQLNCFEVTEVKVNLLCFQLFFLENEKDKEFKSPQKWEDKSFKIKAFHNDILKFFIKS